MYIKAPINYRGSFTRLLSPLRELSDRHSAAIGGPHALALLQSVYDIQWSYTTSSIVWVRRRTHVIFIILIYLRLPSDQTSRIGMSGRGEITSI